MEVSVAFALAAKKIGQFIHRYHVLLFAVLVIGGLSFATFSLYQLISQPAEEATQSTSASFDTKTAARLHKLHSSDQPAAPNLPPGRTNPF